MADWSGSASVACADRADAGWTDDESTACHDRSAVEALYGIEEDTALDTGYEGGASGWTSTRMESVCDG
jgi:hypothetical protein